MADKTSDSSVLEIVKAFMNFIELSAWTSYFTRTYGGVGVVYKLTNHYEGDYQRKSWGQSPNLNWSIKVNITTY